MCVREREREEEQVKRRRSGETGRVCAPAKATLEFGKGPSFRQKTQILAVLLILPRWGPVGPRGARYPQAFSTLS